MLDLSSTFILVERVINIFEVQRDRFIPVVVRLHEANLNGLSQNVLKHLKNLDLSVVSLMISRRRSFSKDVSVLIRLSPFQLDKQTENVVGLDDSFLLIDHVDI